MTDLSISISLFSIILSMTALIASFFTHSKIIHLLDGHKEYGKIENNDASTFV